MKLNKWQCNPLDKQMNTFFLVIFLYLISFGTVFAQSNPDVKGDAAFLFSYYPKEGEQAAFVKGYSNHLDWHRKNNDPLVWYGWFVVSGERLGMFVDGTFGISFRAFDNRPFPSKDGAHFRKYVLPHAETAYRKVCKLQRDLSTITRLEDWVPTTSIDVYNFSLVPGKEMLFEQTVSELVAGMQHQGIDKEFTVYRQLTGGTLPSYLLMVPHEGFNYFDSDTALTTLTHMIELTFPEKKSKILSDNLSKSVRDIYSETWLYREGLSYFPGRD